MHVSSAFTELRRGRTQMNKVKIQLRPVNKLVWISRVVTRFEFTFVRAGNSVIENIVLNKQIINIKSSRFSTKRAFYLRHICLVVLL